MYRVILYDYDIVNHLYLKISMRPGGYSGQWCYNFDTENIKSDKLILKKIQKYNRMYSILYNIVPDIVSGNTVKISPVPGAQAPRPLR